MISISRSFKILIIDDNETDLKVVQRLISKDYKSIDVTARSGVTDWKIFLEGSKFDLILLNYAAGSSVGLQEIKKIIAVNDTIPIYIMIWQHEVEVGMKAIYQGAEGFVIKDKTYLNLKKIIQRTLINYLIYAELNSLREINDIISEEVNDGFFRFTKEGELEYISDKFASLLGFDTDFETDTIFAELFKEIKGHIKSSEEYDREISFSFETTGKNDKRFWFEVFVYKKIDLRNDTLFYEGVLKNVSGIKNQEEIINNLKGEKELLLNNSTLPVEVYGKDGKKISSNPAFTKMMASLGISGKEPINKSPEYPVIKEYLQKASELNSYAVNCQKITLGGKEKYFDINYISSRENPDTFFAFYNDISENIKFQKILADINNRRSAYYNVTDIGFIELDSDERITGISERAMFILDKGINNYTGASFIELFADSDVNAVKSALSDCKKSGSACIQLSSPVKLYLQIISGTTNEVSGFVAALEYIAKAKEIEEALISNSERVTAFSNFDNIFLWSGCYSGNSVKPEYVSKGVEKITGYSAVEALDSNCALTAEIFGLNEISTKEKLLKFIKETPEREINFRDKKGAAKRLKIKINQQKESKDSYKLFALVEDITGISELSDSLAGVADSIKNILKDEEALLRIDETLVVREVCCSSMPMLKDIAAGSTLNEISGLKDFSILDSARKAISDNTLLDSYFFTENGMPGKYRILMMPHVNYAGEKSLYIYLKDVTRADKQQADYEYLSKIIDSIEEISGSVVLILENDNILFTNKGFDNLAGFKKEELFKKNFGEFFVNHGCYEEFQKQLKLLKKKNHIELNIKLKDKSSATKYCRFNCSVIQRDGLPDRMLLIGEDETEKETIKKEIRYKTELENIISNSADEAVIIWSGESVIYCNNMIESVFGYTKKEIRDLNKADLFSPMQADGVKENIDLIFNAKDAENSAIKPFEVICKKKHGQEFFAEASFKHHKLLSEDALFLVIRDISEKKNLQKAIFNIDNRFRGVIDSLNEGIWLFDSEYKTIFISPVLLGFLNYSIDEIHEKRIFHFIKDSGFEFDKRYFEEEASARYSNLDLSFIKNDNSFFRSKANIIPLKDEKGVFLGGILAVNDMSDILSRDHEIKEFKENNAGLSKKIRGLEADLEQSRKLISDYKQETENLIVELEEKINSTKSVAGELAGRKQFINRLNSSIQNNLRSQIVNITGFAGFLEEVWDKLNAQQQKTYLKILLDSAKQSRAIFEKISLFYKINSGCINVNKGIIDLSSCSERILSEHNEKISAKKLTVENEISRGLIMNGDGRLIEFVIQELISNAVNYTGTEGRIKLTLQAVRDKISLTIENTGKGLSAEKMRRLFDPDKVHPVNNSKGEAVSGLSLLIIKALVELHNGTIEASSEEGKGFKINVILPVAGNKIFLIGSDSDCEILQHYFSNNNQDFSAVSFSNTSAALEEAVENGSPAAFFVTYSQPEEKFFGFLDELNAMALNKTPVAPMSSDDSVEFKKKLLDHGIQVSLKLPLKENDIMNALEGMMFK